MIKNLRKKFTIVAMCSMFAVLATIMGVFNIVNYMSIVDRADQLLTMIADNDGTFPSPPSAKEPEEKKETEMSKEPSKESELTLSVEEKKKVESEGEKVPPKRKQPEEKKKKQSSPDLSPESAYDTRFFTVRADEEGKITAYDMGNIAAVGQFEAKAYAEEILGRQSLRGFKGIYRYRKVENEDGSMVIFLDRRRELASFKNNLFISLSVSGAGIFAVFLLVVIFSKIVFRPVAESYQKQKQFITDASHEIKTPLTIIDANTEVLEMEYGENTWTKSTRRQIQRLGTLTRQLVILSKLDEEGSFLHKEEFSISEAVEESVEAFRAFAVIKEIQIEIHVEKNVLYVGDEKAICQLVSILMDNAVKYSLERSNIDVTLLRKGRRILLKIVNQAENLPQGNLNVLFERFYRMDSSRNSETGGSGIGLSIAYAIVQAHKGKIIARSEDGKKMCLQVKL